MYFFHPKIGKPAKLSDATQKEIVKNLQIPQFVLLSFDGSKSAAMWEETRAFAKQMTAQGAPLKFTYYISGVYLLAPGQAYLYQGPHHKAGESAIGFGESVNDVKTRVKEINAALAEGNEIGSHVNGHYDGSRWSYDDWKSEFTSFDSLVKNVSANNPGIGDDVKINLKPGDMVGFRAPELGVNGETNKALKDMGYRYDASRVSKMGEWPKKDANGLWLFPLSNIRLEKQGKQSISMDYSVYVAQTNAQSTLVKNTPEWKAAYKDLYDAYINYFNYSYSHNHAPVIIGHHFSKWNDGLYWEVMKDFAATVCGKPDVRCSTFKDLADYLDQEEKNQQTEQGMKQIIQPTAPLPEFKVDPGMKMESGAH